MKVYHFFESLFFYYLNHGQMQIIQSFFFTLAGIYIGLKCYDAEIENGRNSDSCICA